MEIINNRKSKEKTFKDLQLGDVFIDGDGDICMKLHTAVVDNAVMLEDGSVICTDFNAIVIPVKATLTIEGDE